MIITRYQKVLAIKKVIRIGWWRKSIKITLVLILILFLPQNGGYFNCLWILNSFLTYWWWNVGRLVSLFVHFTFFPLKLVGCFSVFICPSSHVDEIIWAIFNKMHTMCIRTVQYHVCYICPIKSEDKEEKVNLIRISWGENRYWFILNSDPLYMVSTVY